MQILRVVLTDYWFDEIKSGRKKHEYRKATPFWDKRIKNAFKDWTKRSRRNCKNIEGEIMMDERFYEMAAQITAWHEHTFPDATEESQILKLNEEFAEYADGEFIEELADVFIVAASLSERWGNMMGTFTMAAVVKHAGKDADLLMRKIREKMDVNVARNWVKLPDGRYKHTEGKKDE